MKEGESMSISNLVNVKGDKISSQKITYDLFADHKLSKEEEDYISELKESDFLEFTKSKGWHAKRI